MGWMPKELLKSNLFHVLDKSQDCDQCDDKFGNEIELKGHVLSSYTVAPFVKLSLLNFVK